MRGVERPREVKPLTYLTPQISQEACLLLSFDPLGNDSETQGVGEANDRIFETMKHVLKMDMLGDTLRLKSSTLGGGIQMAQDYGREIAKKLEG